MFNYRFREYNIGFLAETRTLSNLQVNELADPFSYLINCTFEYSAYIHTVQPTFRIIPDNRCIISYLLPSNLFTSRYIGYNHHWYFYIYQELHRS